MKGTSLTRFAWLSIAAAVLTIGLKITAWWITGSVGLLADAMESVVNLVGGLMALAGILLRPSRTSPTISHKPMAFVVPTQPAHIRKVNPRDDTTDLGGGRRTLRRRILRRGIPYGPPLENRTTAGDDKADRGLLFLSYQVSIEEQFEFLTQNWVNSPKLPNDYDQDNRVPGHDPIIGQNGSAANRARVFTLRGSDGSFETIEVPNDFVIPTRGGYLFAPSITALTNILAG